MAIEGEKKRERLPVSVSSAVFIEDDQGRLLLLQQAADWKGHMWGPPAGGINAHEDPVMAAVRETREEIGVEIKLVDILGIYTIDRGENKTGIGFVFRGKITGGKIKIPEDEIMNYRYFTSEEIQELIDKDLIYKPEYNLRCVKDWLAGDSYPLETIKVLV